MLLARSAVLSVLAFALTGCARGDGEERTEPPRSGPVAVTDARDGVDARYVVASRLFETGTSEPQELAAAVNTNLIGNLAPAAVPAPDGRLLAYNSWRGRAPVLRLRDLQTGEDEPLEVGAHSVAWRRDGAVAYFKALTPEVGVPKRYLGHVVVRAAPGSAAVRWTPPGRFVVAAWAGRRVIAYRLTSAWPDLLVLDGPRRVRMLARAGALVAVSPDGRRAFVSTYGASPPLVRVLDLASGRELARRVVRTLRWLSESGSWTGPLVAATADAGAAVFRVGARTIALEQILRFGSAGFTAGPFEPRLEAGGRRVVGWAELASRPREAVPRVAVVSCDRSERRCEQAPPVSSAVALRLVYDPSRP